MSEVAPRKPEKRIIMILTIVVPFFIAGFGMVAAGILFDAVQSWVLYTELKEIIVLVPALLGLKGNLEMTLASRLSTQVKSLHTLQVKYFYNYIKSIFDKVNLKMIHDSETTKRAIIGNFCLTQVNITITNILYSNFFQEYATYAINDFIHCVCYLLPNSYHI